MVKIVVVGAGVTGLTTSYLLSEQGYDVTIVSKRFHFDGFDDPTYTSNFAGANWASFASLHETRLQNFDKFAYVKFLSLARKEPKSGVLLQYNVVKISKKVFAEAKGETYQAKVESFLPWYKNFVEEFKVIPSDDHEIEFAYSYLGIVISTTTYLGYLLSKCVDNGVTYKRVSLDHILDANKHHTSGEIPDLIVNCSGISASKLGGVQDSQVFPIKGQTIVVENNYPYKVSVKLPQDPKYPNESLYLMPRLEGGCVIGGCMLLNDWDGTPDLAMSERIKSKAKRFCPELVDPNYKLNPTEIKVIRHQVGFRPGRKGDVRVERDATYPKIIHNYGAGGTGFQSSYGTCSEVVRIVNSIAHGEAKL